MLSDDELLDFDANDLFDVETLGETYDGHAMLCEHGDVFRSQLLRDAMDLVLSVKPERLGVE